MWKLIVGFALFAIVAIYMLSSGGNIDMGGEKHEIAHEAPAASAAPAVAASAGEAVPAAASAASN